MPTANLLDLSTWLEKSGSVNVVIETAKGCRNKFEFEPETGSFALSKVLPRGMTFPYDFGFIPSTLADDGDPLDVLVLMDEPAFAGCRIACRLVGVIEGEQTKGGSTERNDRLLAVAEQSQDHNDIHSLKDLDNHLLDQIEHFFVAYHDLDGHKFKPIGRHGPNRAEKLVKEAAKHFAKNIQQSRK
jgi:inorganic pyrophosphatase